MFEFPELAIPLNARMVDQSLRSRVVYDISMKNQGLGSIRMGVLPSLFSA
jgi:hypothetical protein